MVDELFVAINKKRVQLVLKVVCAHSDRYYIDKVTLLIDKKKKVYQNIL